MATNNALNQTSPSLTVTIPSGSDAQLQYDVNGTSKWALGIDDTDSVFKLSRGNTLGTNDAIRIDTNGSVSFPTLCSFCYALTSTVSNVTGDGTPYQLTTAWNSAIWDTNSDVSSGVFTAPAAGTYWFSVALNPSDLSGSFTRIFIYLSFSTFSTSQMYLLDVNAANVYVAAGANYSLNTSFQLPMDAADTLSVYLVVDGSGKTIDLTGDATSLLTHYFMGYLVG